MSYVVTEWERGRPTAGAGVLALGVFDGVHMGHQALLGTAVQHGRESDVSVAAVTFDRDPDQVVTPDSAAPQLLSLDEKVAYLGACEVDHVIVLPFCMKMSKLPPRMFVEDILSQAFDPCEIVVGTDFRFGNQASGDVALLERLGAESGFDVTAHELLEHGGSPVTSTRIRELIAEGDVRSAVGLLTREHRITGRVTRGRGEGADIAVPTANLTPERHAAVPADGVYAGHALVEDVMRPAAISVGAAPSFPGSREGLEVHVIGYEGDLYHTDLTVTFAERIRDLHTFDDPGALRDQIIADIARVQEICQ